MDTTPPAPAVLDPSTEPRSGWLEHRIDRARNVIVVAIRKGGAGKTTVTLLLADALARMGRRVLLIDMDPQGNLSSATGSKVHLVPAEKTRLGRQEYQPDRFTVVDVIESGEPGVAAEAVQLVPWGSFYEAAAGQPWSRGGPLTGQFGEVGIIPCYAQIETQAKTWAPRDLERLARALLQPGEPGAVPPHMEWDVVLIDTPPGGSDVGRQGMKAAHSVFLVTNAERFGVEAIGQTLEYIADVRDGYHHPDLRTLGLVFNDYDPRRKVVQAQTADVEAGQASGNPDLAVPLWPYRLPVRGVIADAQDAEAPLSALLGDSRSRKAAAQVCQVVEPIALRILTEIGHPQAEELAKAWSTAWPSIPEQPTGS